MFEGRTKMKTMFAKDLQEKKRHGSIMFPFNIYPCTIPKDFRDVPIHWQESMEIIFIKKGKGYAQVDTQWQNVESGTIYVVPPGTLHALKEMPGYSMEYENIIFELGILGRDAADICAQEYLIPLAAGKLIQPLILKEGNRGYDDVKLILNETERLCGAKMHGYELSVKAMMLQILFLLLQNYPEKPKDDSANTERLKQVLQKLDEEYTEHLTIDMMAKAVGCSASHFMKWFKQMTGTSFGTFMNDKRLAMAAHRLKETDEKILTIAANAGFENLSNFNRQFKNRYGMTPRQYRNN